MNMMRKYLRTYRKLIGYIRLKVSSVILSTAFAFLLPFSNALANTKVFTHLNLGSDHPLLISTHQQKPSSSIDTPKQPKQEKQRVSKAPEEKPKQKKPNQAQAEQEKAITEKKPIVMTPKLWVEGMIEISVDAFRQVPTARFGIIPKKTYAEDKHLTPYEQIMVQEIGSVIARTTNSCFINGPFCNKQFLFLAQQKVILSAISKQSHQEAVLSFLFVMNEEKMVRSVMKEYYAQFPRTTRKIYI